MIERLKNPLENWPNSDLLLEDAERKAFGVAHPRLLRVLDFPELRTAFDAMNAQSAALKKSTHANGVQTLCVGSLGVALLGVSGLLEPGSVATFLQMAALALTVLAGAWGTVSTWTRGDTRTRWLRARWQTERIRQFHFQYLLNTWNGAVKAMSDDASLATFRESRLKCFEEVNQRLREWADPVETAIQDIAHDNLWLKQEWSQAGATPDASAESEELAGVFRELRIGIQLRYSKSQLTPDMSSPAANATALGRGTTLSFALTPVLAFLSLMSHVVPGLPQPLFNGLMILSGTLALLLQALQLGLRTNEEKDRYDVYHAQLHNLAANFASPDIGAKYVLLRQLEAVAYDELRGFLKTHSKAKFTI